MGGGNSGQESRNCPKNPRHCRRTRFSPPPSTLIRTTPACLRALGRNQAGGTTYLPQRSTALGGRAGTGVETTFTPFATTQTGTVNVRSTEPVAT